LYFAFVSSDDHISANISSRPSTTVSSHSSPGPASANSSVPSSTTKNGGRKRKLVSEMTEQERADAKLLREQRLLGNHFGVTAVHK